ncbi:MAG TPA: alkaline phosphatase family protein [Actinomycetota bacterium]|jgi:phospholipase C|nr:alkaline phosphatase family protein [Actinomycetota bacterium]
MSGELDRREFLRAAGLTVAAASLGPRISSLFGGSSAEAEAARGLPGGSILDLPAKSSPVDHVVVLMMENRSFDHYFGWLRTDAKYLDYGKSNYGRRFYVEGDQTQAFRDEHGKRERTYYLPGKKDEPNPYRGCGHPDPGHGWDAGRAQRDRGFLGKGSGNDEYALGYYNAVDVPLYEKLVRRFTTFDRYHCSLLGPTFPNREYMHSAQSGEMKSNDFPSGPDGFEWEAIWDRLAAANVPAAYYFVDLPAIALWGSRMVPYARHLEHFFADCAAGTLPNVTFVDPGFTTDLRTDDHPHADMRVGQRFVFNVFKAFAMSPHWNSGAFFINYDEWGGFFDHVRPPVLHDNRRSRNDQNNWGQAGFRTPTLMASPYARPGYVDHRLYDHTSILRFIEWRFLGAPAEGPGGGKWYLTQRDRHANNIGRSLMASKPNPEIELDTLPQVPVSSPPCEGEELQGLPVPDLEPSPFEQALHDGFFERVGFKIDLRPLPYSTDD